MVWLQLSKWSGIKDHYENADASAIYAKFSEIHPLAPVKVEMVYARRSLKGYAADLQHPPDGRGTSASLYKSSTVKHISGLVLLTF